ncbi:hypothetical protein HELRODRAFT_67753, partial [Helobdella robusta]|uniref:Uncharacterized protein n=1 Tax=Helobdella robusta TaxID=6412 RepID=T1FZ47_HELRO
NYRPISLTSVSCKVIEPNVKDKLMDHFQSNYLFFEKQFEFLPGRSIVTQLLYFLNNVTKAMNLRKK